MGTQAEELTANDFVNLGRFLCVAKNPSVFSGTTYRAAIDDLCNVAEKCNFQGTLNAARSLRGSTFYVDATSDRILPDSAHTLRFVAEGVAAALCEEALGHRAIVSIRLPPEDLVNLAARIGRPLEAHQQALQEDVVTCLQAHLSRPAIVASWALGYDIVRSWIFMDPGRISDFNSQLAKTAGRGPSTVADYRDFFKINEYNVLQTCRDAQGSLSVFTDKTHRDLQGLLDQRNDFAHANFNYASEIEATAYVERVIRTITNPPFI